jgi:hypothetical protein
MQTKQDSIFRAMSGHTYLFKNEGAKSSKERVTVRCCANMKGEKRDLQVFGKSKNPRCFKGVSSLPVDYVSNANASMTSVIFNDWLVKWNIELKQKIVFPVDNCTAHKQFVSKEHQSDLLAWEHYIVNSAMCPRYHKSF